MSGGISESGVGGDAEAEEVARLGRAREDDGPGEAGRLAAEVVADQQAADATDRLSEHHTRHVEVAGGEEADVVPAAEEPAREDRAEQPAVVDDAAVPDLEDLPEVVPVLVPLHDHEQDAGADQPADDEPHQQVADLLLGHLAGAARLARGEPVAGEKAERDHETEGADGKAERLTEDRIHRFVLVCGAEERRADRCVPDWHTSSPRGGSGTHSRHRAGRVDALESRLNHPFRRFLAQCVHHSIPWHGVCEWSMWQGSPGFFRIHEKGAQIVPRAVEPGEPVAFLAEGVAAEGGVVGSPARRVLAGDRAERRHPNGPPVTDQTPRIMRGARLTAPATLRSPSSSLP